MTELCKAKTAAFLLVMSSVFLLLNSYSLIIPLGMDQILISLMTKFSDEGLIPYKDIWENNFPGIIMLYAIAYKFFGKGMAALQLFDILYRTLNMVVVFFLCRELFNHRIAVIAAFAYMLVSTAVFQKGGMIAQRESFIILPLLLSFYLILRSYRDRALLKTFLAGFVFGMACMIKPNIAVLVPFFLLMITVSPNIGRAWRRALFSMVIYMIGVGIFPFSCFAYFWWKGALAEMWNAVITFHVYYAKLPDRFGLDDKLYMIERFIHLFLLTLPFLTSFACIGSLGIIVSLRKNQNKYAASLLLFMPFIFFSLYIQHRMYPYHPILLMAPGIPLAAYGLACLTDWIEGMDIIRLIKKSTDTPDIPKESDQTEDSLLENPLSAMGFFVLSLVLIVIYYELRIAFILAGIAVLIIVLKMAGLYSDKSRAIFSICLPVFILLYYSTPKLFEHAPDYSQLLRWASEGFDEDFSMDNKLAELDPALVEIIHLIRSETNEDDRIVVWGRKPHIYYLADRRPASRFTWDYPLTLNRKNVEIPESYSRFQSDSRMEFSADVIANRPKFAIVMQNDQTLTNPMTSVEKLKFVPAFSKFLSENYKQIREYNQYRVYRLQNQ